MTCKLSQNKRCCYNKTTQREVRCDGKINDIKRCPMWRVNDD